MSKKTTARYQNPDDAPINYSDDYVNNEKSNDVETLDIQKNETNNSETVIETENSNKDELDKLDVKNDVSENTVSMKSSVSQDIPESIFTNYVSVRIIGRSKIAGKHMMSPIAVANMVMEGNADFCILTSQQTARLIRKIIMNYGSRLNSKDVSNERKEQMLSRFENNLKKFKF